MAEKAETTEHETEELEEEMNQVKNQLEAVMADCTHWKEKTAELKRTICRIKSRESRGPNGIYNAVQSAITALASLGMKPLSPPHNRVKGRVYQLVNELAFAWRIPPSMIPGIISSVSRATVEVCYGGHVDNVDVDMGKRHEVDEHEHGGSPVLDAAVAGPSDPVVLPLEGPANEVENA